MNYILADYAIKEGESRGRLHKENLLDINHNSLYSIDKDRIINSSAFRRLQYKTQVFVNHEGDHYRTRLTHSLEVSRVANSIAMGLGLNRDLTEVIALAHDLGHPPFGHAGEDALNLKMKEFNGFSHNIHTLKIITDIETRYVEYNGLNLTWESIEGIVKHNGSIDKDKKLDCYLEGYNKIHELDLYRSASLEAQVAAIADDITYNSHDIEDGIRAGLVRIEDIYDVPVIGRVYQQIVESYKGAKQELLIGEARKRSMYNMISDVINNSKLCLSDHNVKNVEEVRKFDKNLITFSHEYEKANLAIKEFLYNSVYKHKKLNRMKAKANKIISNLFDFYFSHPECFLDSQEFLERSKKDKNILANFVSDYIAGMTDRFAIKEYEELIG